MSRLKCTDIQSELQEKLCELLPALPVDTDTVEHAWTVFRDAVFSAAETALGFCKRKHQDWFDQNDQDILTLIEANRSAHAAWLSDKNSASKHAHFKQLRGQVQSRMRELKNAWWADKATEVQNHADNKRSKEFYAGLKSIFGPVQCTTAPIRNRDGMLLTDKEDILKQWTLHFSTLLNRTSEVTDEALESIRKRPMITELDAPPNAAEADAAIKQLQTGKAPGPDGIPAEVFKAGGETLITHLTRMFQVFWANGQLPRDLRDANIIHLYKNKGDRSSCDNHRGISLLSIAGKILARIMLNRITKHILDDVVSESQCGFRKQRGTVDMVFAIRQLQEKCVEQHQDLHLLFIDLTKAFDTVNRAALWAILSKLGCPPRFVQIIHSFHDGMFCRVIENGDASDPFPVSNGVKQGCVLAPTLFSLLFAQMLSAALSQTEAGVKIHYRTDGDVFNLRRLKSYTKVTRAIVRDFLFADDCALAAHSEVDLQELADCFATAAKSFGLTVSIKKTEMLRQLAPNTARPPPNITMDGNALKNVDTFKYLGSCINSAANLDDEALCRISRASQAFGRLHTRVWHEQGISIKTKLSVYRAVVLPSLLYGCETWTCYRRHTKKLDQFHLRCLRKVLCVSWKDHVPNHEILRRAELTGIEAMLNQAQLRWSGHVTRMDDSRLPKQLFHAELATGKRHKGGQKKRYKDVLKLTLKAYNIPVDEWQALAHNRPAWRAAIRKGTNHFERSRLQSLDEKRSARKNRVPNPSTAVPCLLCSKICASTFGLQAHMCKHQH